MFISHWAFPGIGLASYGLATGGAGFASTVIGSVASLVTGGTEVLTPIAFNV